MEKIKPGDFVEFKMVHFEHSILISAECREVSTEEVTPLKFNDVYIKGVVIDANYNADTYTVWYDNMFTNELKSQVFRREELCKIQA